MAHDKFKSCEGCPDRTVEPNCHDVCEGYKARQERQRKVNEAKFLESSYKSYKQDRILTTMQGKSRTRKKK